MNNMKTVCTISMIILVISLGRAQSFSVENWNKLHTDGHAFSSTLIVVSAPINKTLSFESTGLVSTSGFAQWYAGIGGSPMKNMFISSGIGLVAQGENKLRLAGLFAYKLGSFASVNIVEWGPSSGYWYTSHQMFKVSDKVKLGMMGRRYLGIGPRVEYTTGKMTVWSSVNYEYEVEQVNVGLGVKLAFE